MRIDLISVALLAFTTSFSVIYRGYANNVMLAMMLSYVLTLQDFLLYAIRLAAMIELRMVSADRMLKLLEIPQESPEDI